MACDLSRRFVLGGIGSVIGSGAALAGAPLTSLRPVERGADLRRLTIKTPEELIAGSGLSGSVAYAVADVKTGLRLEAFRAQEGQPPASVAKALTALYALDVLGPDHRFATRVLRSGPLVDGVLKGDLILAGGGDPTLDTRGLGALAKALKAAGLREVRGDFLVYDGALPQVHSIDPGQPDHVGYSPAVSGIALNFNRVHFEWRRASKGYAVTMEARTEGYRPAVEMAEMKVINRAVPVYTYADTRGKDIWTVARQALGKGGARWLPVRKPALYAADVFRTLARSGGLVLPKVRVVDRLPAGATELTGHKSAPLTKVLRDMLKYSTNLTAEMVGMSAAAAEGSRPVSLAGSADRMNRWAAMNMGMTGTRLVDHSGLGDASRMTADDLVTALVAVRKRNILRPLLKRIGMRNAKGGIDRDHPITVDAKTGTLNFVSGLGGFMTTPDGTELAFAIFTADPQARSRIKRADREVPQGARSWNRRSKRLQQKLIERWGVLYGS